MSNVYVILSGEGPDMEFVEVEDAEGRGVCVKMEAYPNHAGLFRLGPFTVASCGSALSGETDDTQDSHAS